MGSGCRTHSTRLFWLQIRRITPLRHNTFEFFFFDEKGVKQTKQIEYRQSSLWRSLTTLLYTPHKILSSLHKVSRFGFKSHPFSFVFVLLLCLFKQPHVCWFLLCISFCYVDLETHYFIFPRIVLYFLTESELEKGEGAVKQTG